MLLRAEDISECALEVHEDAGHALLRDATRLRDPRPRHAPSRESVDITAESDLDHVAESVDKLAAGKSGGKAVVKIAP